MISEEVLEGEEEVLEEEELSEEDISAEEEEVREEEQQGLLCLGIRYNIKRILLLLLRRRHLIPTLLSCPQNFQCGASPAMDTRAAWATTSPGT